MKILFFNIEHYLPFEEESQNYQVRLPIINCGLAIEYRDHVHQRDLRKSGRAVAEEKALEAVDAFKPDAIVYFQCWRDEDLSDDFFGAVRKRGIQVISFIWDSNVRPRLNEILLFRNSDCLLNTDSVDAHLRWRLLAELVAPEKVVGLGMGKYYIPRPQERLSKKYDVALLGSLEEERIAFADQLAEALDARGIKLMTVGGLMGLVEGPVSVAETRETQFLDWDEYDRFIRASRICVNTQTVRDRQQIKGKVFEIIGRGTFCMTDRNPDFLKVFDGVPLVGYSSIEECVEKIEYYLKLDKQREAIAQQCFNWFHETLNPGAYFQALLNKVVKGKGEVPSIPAVEKAYDEIRKNKDALLPIFADACSTLVTSPR